jgi:hypothetical protein
MEALLEESEALGAIWEGFHDFKGGGTMRRAGRSVVLRLRRPQGIVASDAAWD